MPKASHYITVYLRYTHLYLRNVCLQTYRNNRMSWKLAYFLRKIQTSRINNSRILRIKNKKLSGYCFYLNPNITVKFLNLHKNALNVKFHYQSLSFWIYHNIWSWTYIYPEVYLVSCQTSMMEIFLKTTINVWQGPKYSSASLVQQLHALILMWLTEINSRTYFCQRNWQ